MIRRKIIIALLALGTVGGFASGIHSMRRGHCGRRYDAREMNGGPGARDDGPWHRDPRKGPREE